LCEKKAKKGERVSMIGALCKNKISASLVFTGSCDREAFKVFLKNILIPSVPNGSTFCLDNLSVHKGEEIAKIIRDAGCFLKYTPTYSPDLNPIEHHWSHIKYKIKNKMQNENQNLWNATINTFSQLSN
jgi:transposase